MFCSIYLYQSDLYQKLLISYVAFCFWDPAKKAALVSNQKLAQRECSSCKLCYSYRLKMWLTTSNFSPFSLFGLVNVFCFVLQVDKSYCLSIGSQVYNVKTTVLDESAI